MYCIVNNGGITGIGSISTTSTISSYGDANICFSTVSRSINQQGLWLQWNRSAGSSFIINQKGGGTGDISFGESDTANNYTQKMFLDGVGNLSITGNGYAATPLPDDNSTQIATTAFVKSQGFAPLVSPIFTTNISQLLKVNIVTQTISNSLGNGALATSPASANCAFGYHSFYWCCIQ